MTQAEVTFDELHAEYLREIEAKVRAEAEVERLRAALSRMEDADVHGNLRAVELENEVERLKQVLKDHDIEDVQPLQRS